MNLFECRNCGQLIYFENTHCERCSSSLSTMLNFDPYREANIDNPVDAWLPLTYAVNSLNRSMGQTDPYPFILVPAVLEKLRFVHQSIHRIAG